jgi:hypothetical protein
MRRSATLALNQSLLSFWAPNGATKAKASSLTFLPKITKFAQDSTVVQTLVTLSLLTAISTPSICFRAVSFTQAAKIFSETVS